MTTIKNLLIVGTKKIDRLDAELILAHVLKKKREFVITHPEFLVPCFPKFRFQNSVSKRTKGIPLAYLTGHKEFFGLDFLVNKHTLIPRPETEVLIEEALKEIKKNTTIIDVGTGSGCIPISIIKSLKANSTTYATDISAKALRMARKNAAKHAVEIKFFKGNLLEPIIKNYDLLTIGSELIITANLPYLTQKQFDEEVSIQHEPHSALVAEDNGLALYKNLLNQIQFLISNFQFRISAFFEIDPSQSLPLSKHVHNLFPNPEIKIIKDGMGNDRVIHIIIDKSTHS